jgi:prepilin-type N-terminal cleavage/methylation domain-containing protein
MSEGVFVRSRSVKSEDGFTLIELLVVMALMAILFALGALALRHFWFVQGLEGASDQVVTELRAAQTSVGAENHPVVYGVRFVPGSPTWGVVQYDPRTSPKCSAVETHNFEAAVSIQSASSTGADAIKTECEATLGAASRFIFFFARGSATPGTINLVSQQTGDTRVVQVAGVTGRVESQ